MTDALKEALEHMAHQFAYETSIDGVPHISTGGLSALEEAFRLLGWKDPHPTPERKCDEPGCGKHISCGTPTLAGYRQTCGEHMPDVAYEEFRKARNK